MKYSNFFLYLIILFVFAGCCRYWGDNNLGGEFTLLEGDKTADRIIVYCTGRSFGCCHVGIPIIPSREDSITRYVNKVNYNKKWIIVQSANKDGSFSYWYINKTLSTSKPKFDDNGKFYELLQKNVYGPYDYLNFKKELKENNIKLEWK